MHVFLSRRNRAKQRGAALLIMLVMVLLGFTATLLNSLNASALLNARQATTAEVLAQAKQALIGYAITYGNTHAGQVHGYLPCPDINGGNGEGSSNLGCGSKNISILGRLPWKSLELDALRDGDGECVWYAVSGTHKSTPKTDLMNWDTQGILQVYASDGATLLTPADNPVVAVIFAPGAPLTSQSRAPSGNSAVCGGNYTASNYLDQDTVHSINNAAVSTAANAASQFIIGPAKNPADNVIANDRLIYITRSDLFGAIQQRNDFGASVSALLTTAAGCLSSLAAPATVDFNHSPLAETSGGILVGSLETGRVPKACLVAPLHNWQDNLMYARCIGGTACLTVNDVACKGLIIFSGERNAAQTRTTSAQKNDWRNYLEGAVLTAFTTGTTTFSGDSAYSMASPATDVLACIS